jgi:predicted nucleic acid-binding protein
LAVIVPDASVILKWVLAGDDEPAQTAAVEIRDRWLNEVDRIILPSLWLYEVGNVLGAKTPQHAASFMRLLLDYEFEEAPINADVCRLALELMDACRVTFYDAAYHAVAISADATLVTADERYFKKAGDRGHVKLLAVE